MLGDGSTRVVWIVLFIYLMPARLPISTCSDDPLLADKRFLWECPEPPCPANIDSEYDL